MEDNSTTYNANYEVTLKYYPLGIATIDGKRYGVGLCPYCGNFVDSERRDKFYHIKCGCGYSSRGFLSELMTLEEHNRVCDAIHNYYKNKLREHHGNKS